MQTYKAPLRDMRFVLHELMGSEELTQELGFEDVSEDLIDTVLEEAAKFVEGVLLPLNTSGDLEGCTYENGVVRTPKGFPEAYEAFREGGWTSISSATEFGGQGLPESLAKPIDEMICSANVSFSLYPGLTQGAYVALETYATEELKARYLPKMVDGTWGGTMCLTEAHCGTDLGLLRTRAEPRADGSYILNGSKIFISSGEHDLTENILHLVLARLPDAPKGVKGISLFLVPKRLVTEEGRVGARNGVNCVSIEHKMGIKASATCQINFDDAQGWLVGQANKGMQAMFTMMNSERLWVGIQGLGIAEAAYQSAVAYAKDRLQGRSLSGVNPDKVAHSIIVHPDVRRMLMLMRADIEGCRALSGWVARALDRAAKSQDPDVRREADDFCQLMTPVVKALFTELGFQIASLGVQIHGGHGFVRDHGVEQYIRDARITMIYEGTNGIQALDLVGRKLQAHTGRYLRSFFHPANAFVEATKDDEVIGSMVQSFDRSLDALKMATEQIAEVGLRDAEEAAAAASDYLRLFGRVVLGFMWARMAKVAADRLPKANGDSGFYQAKLTTARFYFDRVLPETGALLTAIKSGKSSMMALDETAF